MFALPATPSSHARQTLVPSTSSPLTPRSANAQRVPPTPSSYKHNNYSYSHSMAMMTMPPSPPVTPPSEGFFAHNTTTRRVDLPTPASSTNSRRFGEGCEPRRSARTSGSNPLLRSAEVQRRSRRDRYLGDVRGRREEALWGTRGDQILQLDFMQSSRRWDAEHARMAPSLPEEIETEDVDMEAGSELNAQGGRNVAEPAEANSWRDLHNNPMQLSQYAERSTSNGTNPDIHAAPTPQEAEEIDLLLQAEAREFDELVAFHERLSQEQNLSEQQHHHHRQQQNTQLFHRSDDDGSRHVMSSSPVYGSENDDDFEDALVRLASGGSEVDGRGVGEEEIMDMS